MTDKEIIIDASKCEWRTGVEHCGNYECMLNKCCDYNCDWYKRRKFEQQLKRKEQEEYETLKLLKNCFDKASRLQEKNEKLTYEYEVVKQCNESLMQALEDVRKEKEELKKELQAQRDFTAHEQKLIYCVAYDETCKTGNDCKQKKCIFKDNIKLKQTLTEIKDYCNKYPQNSIGFKKYILQKISECEANKRK